MRARLRRPRCPPPARPNWVQAPAACPTPFSTISATPIAVAVLLIVALAGVESRRLQQQQKQQAGATVPTATRSDPWAVFTAHSVLPVAGEATAANQSPFLSQFSSAPDDPAVQQDPKTAADAEDAETAVTSAPGLGPVAAPSQPTASGRVEWDTFESDQPKPPSEAANTTAGGVPGGGAAATAAPSANVTSATLPPQPPKPPKPSSSNASAVPPALLDTAAPAVNATSAQLPPQPPQPPSSNASTVPPALLDTAVRIITGDAGALALAQQQSAADGENSTAELDLVAPLLDGGASGLAKLFPPNTTFPVTAQSLRIDDMAGMVVPKGYPLEQHVVVTGDGYKLGTFRIPYGKDGAPPAGVVRPPVLLIHGISLASTCWVVNDPDESLAFILADRGWDVWMMNTRGNTFSRSHVTLSDRQPRFWNFAVDDFALKDFRETLKYVQDVTKVNRIGLVGHSQGGTLALMALADDPWLAESVTALVALGPCAYVKNLESVVLKNFLKQANSTALLQLMGPQELMYMSPETQSTWLNGACQMPGTMISCLTTMEGIFGTSRRISALQYRRYWQIWPSSTSLYNALQWAEIYNEPKARFFKYNYGQEYDLKAIRAPIVMVSGGADVLASMGDIAEQKKRLKDVLKGEHEIPDYSHMDFIWDKGAKSTLYPIVTAALDEARASRGGGV